MESTLAATTPSFCTWTPREIHHIVGSHPKQSECATISTVPKQQRPHGLRSHSLEIIISSWRLVSGQKHMLRFARSDIATQRARRLIRSLGSAIVTMDTPCTCQLLPPSFSQALPCPPTSRKSHSALSSWLGSL